MINWNIQSKDEVRTITKIAKRATTLAKEFGADYPFIDAEMDVTACHLNGCPLKLNELLATDNGNFGHDVFGIHQHIDRDTGKLGDCFFPRFANC